MELSTLVRPPSKAWVIEGPIEAICRDSPLPWEDMAEARAAEWRSTLFRSSFVRSLEEFGYLSEYVSVLDENLLVHDQKKPRERRVEIVELFPECFESICLKGVLQFSENGLATNSER